MLYLLQFYAGRYNYPTQRFFSEPMVDLNEEAVLRLPLGPDAKVPIPTVPNNYRFMRVGNGMSCGEKIR